VVGRKRKPPQMWKHVGADGVVRARVRIDGVDHYLGEWGSDEADAAYRRLLGEWAVAEPGAAPRPAGACNVDRLLAAFMRHARRHYVKGGKPTAELACFRSAVRVVSGLYGPTPAADFGPPQLRAVREAFLKERDSRKGRGGKPWSRPYVNEQVARVVRIWSWGVTEGLVPEACVRALERLPGLRKSKTDAPEGRKVEAARRECVALTLPLVSPTLRALIVVHYLLGCRAEEVTIMRPRDLDREADPEGRCWRYTPDSYKTEDVDTRPLGQHYWVGRAAQELLAPLLAACPRPDAPVFATRRGHYTRDSYGQAVRRACEEYGIPVWSPGGMRHLRLNDIRLAERAAGRAGREGAQAVGGHTTADTTEIYLSQSDLAKRIMADMG
jgi:integrase